MSTYSTVTIKVTAKTEMGDGVPERQESRGQIVHCASISWSVTVSTVESSVAERKRTRTLCVCACTVLALYTKYQTRL